MKANHILLFLLLMAAGVLPAAAQDGGGAEKESVEKKSKKAWEFGLGGSVFQFNRVSFSNFSTLSDGGYRFDLALKHAVYNGNIYIARELNSHFYLDLQGNAGFTKYALTGQDKNKWMYSVGLGLQWRLGEYFKSRYIDPYLRVGAGYMHKDFDIIYTGSEGLSPDEMEWVMQNFDNKDGLDRKDLIPVSIGAGVNMWLNDRWGIGLQGDYVLMPYKNVANSLEGTVRIMYRLGGKSKRAKQEISYIERPVEIEKIVEVEVEKVVEIEKIIEVPGKIRLLSSLFDNIHFDFDKATIKRESDEVLDEIAEVIKDNLNKHFLITGYTDARGSQEYNQSLSERRAKAVVDALVNRGIPKEILKSRGVAWRIAVAEASESEEIRRGDRKVTLEIITNQSFWDYLGKKGY